MVDYDGVSVRARVCWYGRWCDIHRGCVHLCVCVFAPRTVWNHCGNTFPMVVLLLSVTSWFLHKTFLIGMKPMRFSSLAHCPNRSIWYSVFGWLSVLFLPTMTSSDRVCRPKPNNSKLKNEHFAIWIQDFSLLICSFFFSCFSFCISSILLLLAISNQNRLKFL